MRYSQILVPTVKEVPADAEVISHQLMIRAGLMRKVASGTYAYLTLGQRSLQKIMTIVREEMNRTGAQEILLPSLQPRELWDQTGRSADYGPTMFSLEDRHGRLNVLSPTAEEVVTYIAAGEIKSYKQLPFNLYQISPKFRDEFRPRFGVIRSREFIMKDAYSFHTTPECLDRTYRAMYDAYCRIFQRCGIEYVIVEAETGEMGGSGSHQFTVPCQSGEDIIVYTEDGCYAANIERAAVDPLPQPSTEGDYPGPEEVATPKAGSIEEVCAFLKTQPQDMIKTLIYQVEEQIVAVLVRGDHDVNPEKLNQAFPGEHIDLAEPAVIQKTTGAAVGFAGPMGLTQRVHQLLIDHAVAAMPVGITGANKTDTHVKNVVPGRDFALDGANVQVLDIRNACEGDTYQGKPLLFKRGIETGQVFKLGTKYSQKLGATFLDEQGRDTPCLMGCYGIGINRILASAVELGHDENGIVWPINIAPFEVLVTCVNQNVEEVARAAENIYQDLKQNGMDVLLDDRDQRGGGKFKDADLIGIPIRVTVGKRSVEEGNAEVKLRRAADGRKVALADIVPTVTDLVKSLKTELTSDR
jgi:prolyl-tRNA synthetase